MSMINSRIVSVMIMSCSCKVSRILTIQRISIDIKGINERLVHIGVNDALSVSLIPMIKISNLRLSYSQRTMIISVMTGLSQILRMIVVS